ncbi:hypothetical protein CEXT_596681 [Caerostris extrusa]|uniref:Uncharacterized protein n=1 Tax=Caerostris extrusa TaxID=172846 RepID=A0AAV4R3R6_CAEEX|nr:hypothetical protein CEXT_596681 [Caerostris extrusa]
MAFMGKNNGLIWVQWPHLKTTVGSHKEAQQRKQTIKWHKFAFPSPLISKIKSKKCRFVVDAFGGNVEIFPSKTRYMCTVISIRCTPLVTWSSSCFFPFLSNKGVFIRVFHLHSS